ncbi:MAG: hypothetical protein Q9195_003530 [Heterodermia aff. obscurata]
MAAIGKIAASAVSATNEVNLGLANFNIDFALVKFEAPVEYRGLRNALSRRRVENAEQGPLHRTARKLGALFELILPPIKTLAEMYGRRASEIAGAGNLNRQGSSRDGPFASHVGFDGTSIYAAATSGSSAIAVHLLACLLARTWSGPEAIAIWVEIVKERKKDIAENTDPSQLQSLSARVAAQQEISRFDLAAWDASARAWLLSADEVQKFNLTQLRLIIKDSGLFVSSIGSTYKSVIDVWTTAMKTLQDLILGRPQRISKGALLVGLSCWHIYPDLNVVGPLAHVKFNDELVDKGGVVTLGLQSASPEDDVGVRWSLSLSHLRYYGDPVTVTTASGANSSRITMEELHMIALGAVFGAWGACISDPLVGARIILLTRSLLKIKTEQELEIRKPAFHLLWSTAKRLIERSSNIERQSNLCLIAYGRRRAQRFLLRPSDTLSPAFGLAEPHRIWSSLSADRGMSSTIVGQVEKLRSFAGRCSFASGQCVIRFHLPDTRSHIFAYTTAIPICHRSSKRDPDGNFKSIYSHVCWVTDASKLVDRSSVMMSIAGILEYVDPADLISQGSAELTRFSWIRAPESVRADLVTFIAENGDQSLEFKHWIGDPGRISLFRVDERSSRKPLSDWEVINTIEAYSPNLSNAKDGIFQEGPLMRLEIMGFIDENNKKISSSTVLHQSLANLAGASSMYRHFSGATVSISVVNVPMYSVSRLMWRSSEKLSEKFACIAMFETGSNAVHEKQLSSIMALSSGNSIYAANALLQDPLKPDSHGPQGITRIIGNLDRPGLVMLAPPQAPLLRQADPGSWRLINHTNFDGNLENSFPETSLHLSFTEYEVPLSVPIGAKDAEVSIVEALVSTHDRQSWVADLDIIASLKTEKLFRRLLPPRCKHENDRSKPPMETAVTQIGRVSDKQLVSIDSWEELLDPPARLGVSSIGVVRAFDNWHARVATTSVSVQKELRTVVLPTERLCTVCGAFVFEDIEAFAQILIS